MDHAGGYHITRELLISTVNHLILLTNNPMRVGIGLGVILQTFVWGGGVDTGPRPIIYKHLLQKKQGQNKI